MLKATDVNQGLIEFLTKSPTPFHAVAELGSRLKNAGFVQLKNNETWDLKKGSRYFVECHDSTLVAFHMGNGDVLQEGVRIIGAHTDSPCLKVKPQPELETFGFFRLGVEVYGSVL